MEVETPNAVIPGYDLLKKIGHGASGTVWLAIEPVSGRLVAVKILHEACSDGSVHVRELDGIRQIKNISEGSSEIVRILKVDQAGGRYYYSMELADDVRTNQPLISSADDIAAYEPHTLKHVIERDSPLDPDRALDIILHVLQGLDRLHAKGLIHRDIKPANILFIDGRPKLGDLGLVTQSSRDVTQIGTPDYMPPGGRVDKSSDVFAAGLVLYEMIYGLREFPTPRHIEIKDREKRRAFQIANNAANRAVRPLPDERFQSARELLDFIRKARTPSARIVRRTLIGTCCALAVLLVIGGAFSTRSKPALDNGTSLAPGLVGDIRIVKAVRLSGPSNTSRELQVGFSDDTSRVFQFPSPIGNATFGNFLNGNSSLVVGFEASGPDAGKLKVFDASECRSSELPKALLESRFCHLPPAAWDFQDHPGICHLAPLAATDLDGEPGDELILSCKHDDGCCEIIVLKLPDSILGSFWHYGWIQQVAVEDINDDGAKELICSGFANWRDDATRLGQYVEPLNACILVLSMEALQQNCGYWGSSEWLHKGSPVTPVAYGYCIQAVQPDRVWQLSTVDVFRGMQGVLIRASFETSIYIEFDSKLAGIRTAFHHMQGGESKTPPPVKEIWKRTWPK